MRQNVLVLAATFVASSAIAVRADDPATERKPAVIDYTGIFDRFDTKVVSRQNYREGARGNTQIDAIVLQTLVSSDLTLPQVVYKSDAAKKSCHYIVNWKGEIFQMVKDKDVAFHSGSYNDRSIGIACQVSSSSATAWTPALQKSLKALVRHLCQQYDVPRLNPRPRRGQKPNSPGIFCLGQITGRAADVCSKFYGSGWSDFIKALNVPPRLLQEHLWQGSEGATEYNPDPETLYAMVVGGDTSVRFVWDPIIMESLGEATSHEIRKWQFQLSRKNPTLLNTANPWESVIAPTLVSGTSTTYTAAVGTRRGLFEWKLSALNDYGWGEVATMRFYYLEENLSAPTITIVPDEEGNFEISWTSLADQGVYDYAISVEVWTGYGWTSPDTFGLRYLNGAQTSMTIPNWHLTDPVCFHVYVWAWNELARRNSTPSSSDQEYPEGCHEE